jgi:6-pyruvoyltetrahydropterin/6-carboxytetrahydropterin synthase
MSIYRSTKLIELGSCAFRQYGANHSHCQYLHGYQLKAKFVFACTELDEKNWCVDFGGLKNLKKILNDQFDHTLCIASNDPCLDQFKQLEASGACVLRIMPNGVGIERTAEWCFKAASSVLRELYGDRCWVESVEVFEHEANSAVYSESKEITYNEMHPLEHAVTTEPVYTHQPQPAVSDHGPKPAAVGNKVTSGFSNLFAGTSWGN